MRPSSAALFGSPCKPQKHVPLTATARQSVPRLVFALHFSAIFAPLVYLPPFGSFQLSTDLDELSLISSVEPHACPGWLAGNSAPPPLPSADIESHNWSGRRSQPSAQALRPPSAAKSFRRDLGRLAADISRRPLDDCLYLRFSL